MPSEVLQRCNANFSWPASISRTFSGQIFGCTIDEGTDTTHLEELLHCVHQDVRHTQGVLPFFFRYLYLHITGLSFLPNQILQDYL